MGTSAALPSLLETPSVPSVFFWALPLGQKKFQVPQRPDNQMGLWMGTSELPVSPWLLQSFMPLGWGSAESWQPVKKLCLQLGFCTTGGVRLSPLAGGRTGAREFTEPLLTWWLLCLVTTALASPGTGSVGCGPLLSWARLARNLLWTS